jgi:hypothetical protein
VFGRRAKSTVLSTWRGKERGIPHPGDGHESKSKGT